MQELIERIEAAAQSLRAHAQNQLAVEDQRDSLVKSNEYMQGEIAQLQARVIELEKERNNAIEKHEHSVERIGALNATLKELLRQNVDIAAKATEMLKNLEDKPAPIIPPTPKTFASDLAEARTRDRSSTALHTRQEERLLEKLVGDTLFQISQIPEGEGFILDPPYGQRVSKWVLKKWYTRILGECPYNFRAAPSLKMQKESGGGWTFLKQTARKTQATEDKETIPFRKPETSQPTSAFADNGQAIPSFLAKGPKVNGDDNQGREAEGL